MNRMGHEAVSLREAEAMREVLAERYEGQDVSAIGEHDWLEAVGRMEQIMNIANVAAGAGVEALFVTQDTGQVEKAYGPNDARSIFGSCITKRVFNLNDIETAEWAARHLGESTVYSQQIREGKAPNEGRDFSYSEQRQKLMTADQITGMKADDLLLLVGNRNPLKAKQNLYFKSKAYRGRFDQNPLN